MLLVSLVAVAACRDPVSSSPLASMPTAHMAAAAAPQMTNVRTPLLPETIFGPCTGEPITISGELHVASKIWQDGDAVRIQSHLNLNAAGIGLSGRKYLFQQITNTDQEFVFGTPNISAHQVFHLQVISQGKALNWYVTMNGSYESSAAGFEFIPRKWETVCQ
jgi:hypothetical protein